MGYKEEYWLYVYNATPTGLTARVIRPEIANGIKPDGVGLPDATLLADIVSTNEASSDALGTFYAGLDETFEAKARPVKSTIRDSLKGAITIFEKKGVPDPMIADLRAETFDSLSQKGVVYHHAAFLLQSFKEDLKGEEYPSTVHLSDIIRESQAQILTMENAEYVRNKTRSEKMSDNIPLRLLFFDVSFVENPAKGAVVLIPNEYKELQYWNYFRKDSVSMQDIKLIGDIMKGLKKIDKMLSEKINTGNNGEERLSRLGMLRSLTYKDLTQLQLSPFVLYLFNKNDEIPLK